MKQWLTILVSMMLATAVFAQKENTDIANGNKLYREKQYDKAIEAYNKALQLNPDNAIARYNLAAARFRTGKFEEAQKAYESVGKDSKEEALKQKSTYNEGVSLTRQKKLAESIEAYKQALRMNPTDEDTRFNLQKALEELRKQNKSKEPQPKDQKKNKDKKQDQKQPPPPANKKQIEQWLQSLRQKEQEVQQKVQQQKKRTTSQPDKDW